MAEKKLWKPTSKPKIKKAAAIRYDAEDTAPSVIAKGAGVVAENILKVAKDEAIAIVENAELVEELNKIELGDHIPPELYQVVAEVLIFVSDLDELRSKTEKLR
ncbi:flagellar biogenesis protein [Clostridiales bacterium COT073_COT-073]|nr:flagellar biogenesis protein [Clostridiales bacterium COT073_COT-073]